MTVHNASATVVAVVGFGFRTQASAASLRSALQAAYAATESATGYSHTLTALATAHDKVSHPALIELAHELALPLVAVPLAQLTGLTATASLSVSNRIPERYGARSVAESSALAAAGPGAHLLARRAVSIDQMATAAIAVITSIANHSHAAPL